MKWITTSLYFLTACWIVLAVCFWEVRSTETYLAEFWPIYFWFTALVNLLFLFRPSSKILYLAAGGMSVVSLASRIGAIYINCTNNSPSFSWGLFASVIIYSIGFIALWRTWITEVGAWHRLEKSRTDDRFS